MLILWMLRGGGGGYRFRREGGAISCYVGGGGADLPRNEDNFKVSN